VSGNRVSGISIWKLNPDSSQGATNEKMATTDLIGLFRLNMGQVWTYRARAAQLLAGRREAIVPPALLEAMNHDPNLWVRRAALESFQGLAGFQADDVFGFKQAEDWWTKNKDTYLKSVPKQ
jgi:hypothetical protein